MGKKKHIVIITSWYPTSLTTSGIFVKEQAEALQKYGHKVSFFFFHYQSLLQSIRKIFKSNRNNQPLSSSCKLFFSTVVNFIPTSMWKNPQTRQKKIILRGAARRFKMYMLFNGKPDLIHHHCLSDFSYITYYLSKRFNISYAFTEHSNYQNLNELTHFNAYESDEEYLEFVRHASLRIAVSNFYKSIYEKIFDTSFTVIPNMVSSEFEVSRIPKTKEINPFTFINVASICPVKAQDILVKAFSKAFGQNQDIRLILVGQNTSSYAKEVMHLVEKEKLTDRVKFVGLLSRTEVIRLLDQSNVFVLSSLRETFCIALAEAMFRGLPVIVTRNGGSDDVFFPETGFSCEPGSVDELSNAFTLIYSKYKTFQQDYISSRTRSQFSAAIILEKITSHYNQMQ